MKQVIMHYDNVPYIENSTCSIKFETTTSNIDKYISKNIITKIQDTKPDIIYIKDKLSSNYLELYGLKVAYHIRLSEELKDIRFIPIVILSDVDSHTLNKLEPMARILFTKNIFIIRNTKKAIEKFQEKSNLKLLTKEEYQDNFLDLIEVQPPENSSSHSIANEWAIDRWADLLKVKSDVISDNRDKISSRLYFKYLKVRNPLEGKQGLGVKVPKLNGKILYIDDEWDKGWSDIFDNYFSKNPEIKFETFKKDFTRENIFTLRAKMEEKILDYSPDVILLDLRLSANDTDRTDIENFTGIKVRDMIKKINPAIQVIMFTATSKSRNLEELYKHKILGYIKKEHPEDKNIKTKESFAKLADLVDEGFEKKYLKEIWDIQNEILGLEIIKNDEYAKIKPEAEAIFNILDSGMRNRLIYSMFTICKSLEIIKDNYFGEDKIEGKWQAYWKNIESKTYISGYSTEDRLKEIILKIEMDDIATRGMNIKNIFQKRNNIIHPKSGVDIFIVKNDILTWFKMLQEILEAKDVGDKIDG